MKLKTTVRSELRAGELHDAKKPADEKASSSAYGKFSLPRVFSYLVKSLIPRTSFLPFFFSDRIFFLSRTCAYAREDRDENAELANFPQKCSFPADGLSPLADTSSSAGVGGRRCPPFSLLVLPVSLGVCAERVTKISSLIPGKSTTTQRKRHASTELEIKLVIFYVAGAQNHNDRLSVARGTIPLEFSYFSRRVFCAVRNFSDRFIASR